VQQGSSPPADGFSLNWATDLPAGIYATAEEGAGSPLPFQIPNSKFQNQPWMVTGHSNEL